MSNGLDVALMKDPFGEWSPKHGDTHLEIAFSFWAWESFFFKTLPATEIEYISGEPWIEYDSRRRANFRKALHEFPLLSRIDEYYQDASFAGTEIEELRGELNRVANLFLDEQG